MDTGAGNTAIDVHIRNLAGPEIRRPSSSGTAAWNRRRFLRSPEGMRLGPLELRDVAVVELIDLWSLNRWGSVRIDGIIGMDVLSNYVLEWDPNTRSLRFLTGKLPADQHRGAAIKMEFDDIGRPLVGGKMAGKFVARMPVDTGMIYSGSLTSKAFEDLRDLGVVSHIFARNLGTFKGIESGKLGRLSELSIAGMKAQNLVVCSWDRSILGWGFLKHYHATFDFPNATLYLRERKDREWTENWDLSGLRIHLDGSKVRIHRVVPESPAETAGCRDWDLITSVDGRPAGEYTFSQIGELLSKEGETRRLGLLRDGQPLEVVVPLKEYRTFEDQPASNRPQSRRNGEVAE